MALLGLASGCAKAAIPQATAPVAAQTGAVPQIASLKWEQRSDWTNVKTLGAKGDGVADDTAAIQKAFDRLNDGDNMTTALHNRVVYFPAGKYRITSTLNITKSVGAWVVGCGRDTVLLWDGPENGTMYLSNGATYCRYEGITWDGQGRAAVGVEHSSQSYYETNLRYQDCAFIGLREHGVVAGRGKEKVASAEIWFRNCVFRDCGAATSYYNFNDGDNVYDGCEFVDCGIGINSATGIFYARACHFLRSTKADVFQGTSQHASSIRLCTSQGSRRFYETGVGAHLSMKLQDCRVDGWTAPDGAISLGERGPTTIFDCVFTNPPNQAAPIRLANPAGIQQLLVLCNNTSAQTTSLVDKGPNSRVTEVPAGKRSPLLTSADQSFTMESVPPAGKIFDAVRDFGAKGDSSTDDSNALQSAIDAARAAGHGAIVYLPSGQYLLTRTLQVTGSDYRISGTGFRTQLLWAGPKDGEAVLVHNPQGLTLEHFQLEGPNEAVRIHQTCDPGASSVYYDGVYTNGCDEASTNVKGLWCERLPAGAVVKIGHFIGNIHLDDCGPARVLCAISYYSLWLYGDKQPQTGLAGFMFHNDDAHNYALDVRDNQSVLVADFYSEANKRYLLAEGKEGQPAGRITIGGSKMCTTDDEAVTIRNYQGRIFLGGGNAQNGSHEDQPVLLVQEGTRPVDFLLVGQAWWIVPPTTKFGPGMRLGMIENLLTANKYPEYAQKSLPNQTTPTTQAALIAALDDFRELAGAYLQDFFVANK
jgi:hypothetical protein